LRNEMIQPFGHSSVCTDNWPDFSNHSLANFNSCLFQDLQFPLLQAWLAQIPVHFYLSAVYTAALLRIITKPAGSIANSSFGTVLARISLAEQTGFKGKFI
jgi:hypothetical protein